MVGPVQVVRVVSGELHAATDSTDVAIEVRLLLCDIYAIGLRANISLPAARPCPCTLGGDKHTWAHLNLRSLDQEVLEQNPQTVLACAAATGH